MDFRKLILICTFIVTSWAHAQVWLPLKKTCDSFGNVSAQMFIRLNLWQLEAMSDSDRLNYLLKKLEGDDNGKYYSSFLLLQSPSVSIAEGIFKANLIGLNRKLCNKTPDATTGIELISETKKCLVKVFQEQESSFTTYSHQAPSFNTPAPLLRESQNSINKICNKLPLGKDGCKTGIPSFLALTSPGVPGTYGLGNVSYIVSPQEFFRISNEPELRKLSGELSLHYLDLIAEGMKNGSPLGQDIYRDLIAFFKRRGKNQAESESLAFLFLGVYGARGASFLRDNFFHPAPTAAMVILSTGLSYLDKLAHKSGRAYAIPKEFRTTCHLGKPYHFWMAASLSHYAKRQGFSRFVSYYGPLIAGLAYDMTGQSNERYILKLFRIKTPYDHYATMTRLDNWARTMGAHFGTHSGRVISHNADSYLDDLFARGQMPKREPEIYDFEGILTEYNRVIQPIPLYLRLSW